MIWHQQDEVTNHITMSEEFLNVCETPDSCEVFQDVGSGVPLITLKIMYFWKKSESSDSNNSLMSVIIALKILGHF